MMTGPGHRADGPLSAAPGRSSRCAVALAAVAIAGIATSITARAQDGWAPVVVAVAPPQDPASAPDAPHPDRGQGRR